LPPKRSHVHAISLLPNSNSINLKRSLKHGFVPVALPQGLEVADSDSPTLEAILATRENKCQGSVALEWLTFLEIPTHGGGHMGVGSFK